MNLLRPHPKGVYHPTEQQCQLCGLRADVRVGLIDDDPAQAALGLVKDRSVLATHQEILQHRRVGNEDRWRL